MQKEGVKNTVSMCILILPHRQIILLLEKHPSLQLFPLQISFSRTPQRCHSADQQVSYPGSYPSAVPSHLCDLSNIQLAIKVRYEQYIDYIWACDLSNFRNNPQSTPLPTPPNPNPNITGLKSLNN